MGWWEVGWERGTKQPSHLCVLNPQRLHSVRLESADEVSIRLYSSLCCSKPSLSFLRHKLIKLPSSSTCSCCTGRWGLVSGKLPMPQSAPTTTSAAEDAIDFWPCIFSRATGQRKQPWDPRMSSLKDGWMRVELKVEWVKGFKVRQDEEQLCIHLDQSCCLILLPLLKQRAESKK